ncbi:DUF986 family protein [Basfia succiniciproducens]|uniref:UPF0266 membrane protein SAMN02910354_00669 n=1 Tax=Basfia succiniciproducens TaxID=653940 RepID=A0A1G5BAX4_9PAST|nr:DUF986 family protein [Basfia succiniciproducens]QIM68065.1 hypothetical protein A4G13_00940 [Basfia succiniciproducens]SCX87311.1 Uncharacterized membrane protein YobD, UPF0266 family [Basfia succiniciproducens]
MTNTILLICIILFFAYAFYDQFGMDKRKGETKLKVRLKKQAKIDAVIFVILIACLFAYQSKESLLNIDSFTIFLLATAVVLAVYTAFIRSPMLILKEKGFFYSNLFIEYDKIRQLNLAEGNIFVVDLTNGKRLLLPIADERDKEKIVTFFGGYKEHKQENK